MRRPLLLAAALLLPVLSFAQGFDPSPEPKIILVPYPGEADAGAAVMSPGPDNWQPDQPPPLPQDVPPAPPADPLETRTLEATPPPVLLPSEVPETAPEAPPPPPGAFLDGHPREGAFLSGPGSFTFIMHHTIMGGVGILGTQLAPRIVDSIENGTDVFSQDARVAYLAGTLIGAGVGFGASAVWQFNNWISHNTANFSIINSLVGGLFLGGLTNAFTNDATAISWTTFLGMQLGAWLTTVIAGGDLALNKGLLMASGGAWAAIYTSLLLAIVASTGGGSNLKAAFNALMITPAIGVGAMAAATMNFNPSSTQIMRANIFGTGVGGAVLLLSALLLGFNHPAPYILAGVGAIGAKTVVSLLWAEAAESPREKNLGLVPADRRRVNVWW